VGYGKTRIRCRTRILDLTNCASPNPSYTNSTAKGREISSLHRKPQNRKVPEEGQRTPGCSFKIPSPVALRGWQSRRPASGPSRIISFQQAQMQAAELARLTPIPPTPSSPSRSPKTDATTARAGELADLYLLSSQILQIPTKPLPCLGLFLSFSKLRDTRIEAYFWFSPMTQEKRNSALHLKP